MENIGMKNNVYNLREFIVVENNNTGEIWYFTSYNNFRNAVLDNYEWTVHKEYFYPEEICNSFVDPYNI